MKLIHTFEVSALMGAPRMTRADAWKERACVMKYRDMRDQLRAQAKGWSPPDEGIYLAFYLRMPLSWSDKRRRSNWGNPHKQKPDLDNLIKGFYDALKGEDCTVHHVEAEKFWWDRNHIEVYEVEKRKKLYKEQLRETANDSSKSRVL